jgi:hypothetical protein
MTWDKLSNVFCSRRETRKVETDEPIKLLTSHDDRFNGKRVNNYRAADVDAPTFALLIRCSLQAQQLRESVQAVIEANTALASIFAIIFVVKGNSNGGRRQRVLFANPQRCSWLPKRLGRTFKKSSFFVPVFFAWIQESIAAFATWPVANVDHN